VNSLAELKSKFLNSLVLILVVLSASLYAFNQYTLSQPQITDPQLKIDVVAMTVNYRISKMDLTLMIRV
jgi:hypothetical protein